MSFFALESADNGRRWQDRSPDLRRLPTYLRLPTSTGSGYFQQVFTVAHSCGAVAGSHRASRLSGREVVESL